MKSKARIKAGDEVILQFTLRDRENRWRTASPRHLTLFSTLHMH